ncbi:hypothetical protein [Pedobacter mucosus]|nr:hypothetical protein [Pedobacter mucosus]
MHPYIEVVFTLFLAILGTLMIRRLAALKSLKRNARKTNYVQEL